MKKIQRLFLVALPIVISVAAMLLLNTVRTEAQSSGRTSYTVFRDGLMVIGQFTTVGPMRIGNGGSISIHNSSGNAIMDVDSSGNISTTGVITASGFTSTDMVRGFGQPARIIGSLVVPTTTVTGTAVVANGPFQLVGGSCSLAMVPTTNVASCALNTFAGDLVVTVYKANMDVATAPATISWFAYVED